MLLMKYKGRYGLDIWACCLMTNHVHFVAVPRWGDSLARTMRDTHQAYSSWLNRRLRLSGHVWQGRFYSTALDESHLWAPVAYVERKAVRAGMAARAEEYPWSSAAARCGKRPDPLLAVAAATERRADRLVGVAGARAAGRAGEGGPRADDDGPPVRRSRVYRATGEYAWPGAEVEEGWTAKEGEG